MAQWNFCIYFIGKLWAGWKTTSLKMKNKKKKKMEKTQKKSAAAAACITSFVWATARQQRLAESRQAGNGRSTSSFVSHCNETLYTIVQLLLIEYMSVESNKQGKKNEGRRRKYKNKNGKYRRVPRILASPLFMNFKHFPYSVHINICYTPMSGQHCSWLMLSIFRIHIHFHCSKIYIFIFPYTQNTLIRTHTSHHTNGPHMRHIAVCVLWRRCGCGAHDKKNIR